MGINPANGCISWTPAAADYDSGEAVTVKVEVGVTDGELDDTGSFDIEVTGGTAE